MSETCRCCGKQPAFVKRFDRSHREHAWYASWADLLCVECIPYLSATLCRLLVFGR